MCKDAMFLERSLATWALAFLSFFFFLDASDIAQFGSLVTFSNTKREIGGRMLIRASSKV